MSASHLRFRPLDALSGRRLDLPCGALPDSGAPDAPERVETWHRITGFGLPARQAGYLFLLLATESQSRRAGLGVEVAGAHRPSAPLTLDGRMPLSFELSPGEV